MIFLSLMTTLLGLRGALDAAAATDPTSRLLVSLMTDSWPEFYLDKRLAESSPSLRLPALWRVVYLGFGGILIINRWKKASISRNPTSSARPRRS
jgi:hypothetical protein